MGIIENIKNLKFYRPENINQLERRASQSVQEFLLKHHKALTGAGFSAEDLTKIAIYHGSANALKALLDNHKRLLHLGFDKHHLVRIATHSGASVTIHFLIEKYATLFNLGFDNEMITRMASYGGACQTLEFIIENYSGLKKCGFDIPMIVRLAGRSCASGKLKFILKNDGFFKTRGFTSAMMVEIGASICGVWAFECVLKNHDHLIALGFSVEMITIMLSYNGAGKTIKKIMESHDVLLGHGFTNEQIVLIARRDGCVSNVFAFILENFDKFPENNRVAAIMAQISASASEILTKLQALLPAAESQAGRAPTGKRTHPVVVSDEGKTKKTKNSIIPEIVADGEEDVDTALMNCGFSNYLRIKMKVFCMDSETKEFIIKNHAEFAKLGIGNADIVEIATQDDPLDKLQLLMRKHSDLAVLGFDNQMIVAMVSYADAGEVVNCIIQHYATLHRFGFTNQQLAHIAARDSSDQIVAFIVAHFDKLPEDNRLATIMQAISGATSRILKSLDALRLSANGSHDERVTRKRTHNCSATITVATAADLVIPSRDEGSFVNNMNNMDEAGLLLPWQGTSFPLSPLSSFITNSDPAASLHDAHSHTHVSCPALTEEDTRWLDNIALPLPPLNSSRLVGRHYDDSNQSSMKDSNSNPCVISPLNARPSSPTFFQARAASSDSSCGVGFPQSPSFFQLAAYPLSPRDMSTDVTVTTTNLSASKKHDMT